MRHTLHHQFNLSLFVITTQYLLFLLRLFTCYLISISYMCMYSEYSSCSRVWAGMIEMQSLVLLNTCNKPRLMNTVLLSICFEFKSLLLFLLFLCIFTIYLLITFYSSNLFCSQFNYLLSNITLFLILSIYFFPLEIAIF